MELYIKISVTVRYVERRKAIVTPKLIIQIIIIDSNTSLNYNSFPPSFTRGRYLFRFKNKCSVRGEGDCHRFRISQREWRSCLRLVHSLMMTCAPLGWCKSTACVNWSIDKRGVQFPTGCVSARDLSATDYGIVGLFAFSWLINPKVWRGIV